MSVYLIIVIVPIFLFHALLIDVVRIRQAERETESAVRKGVRSVMSTFDSRLQTYGLFGVNVGIDRHADIFPEVANRNMRSVSSVSSFSDLDIRFDKDGWKVSALHTLANHSVFRQQVQEEMKYRAPIEFALELTDKFRKTGVSSSLAGTASFADHADELEKLMEKREKALDQAWNKALEVIDESLKLHGSYERKLAELYEWGQRIGLHDVNELRRALSDAEESIRSMRESADKITEALTKTRGRIAELSGKAEELAEELQSLYEEEQSLENDLQSAASSIDALAARKIELDQLIEDAVRYAAAVQAIKLEIGPDAERFIEIYKAAAAAIDEAQRLNDDVAQEKLTFIGGESLSSGASAEVWQHVPVYELSYFSVYKTDLAKLAANVQGLRQKIGDTILFTGEAFEKLSASVSELQVQAIRFRNEQGAKEGTRQSKSAELTRGKNDQRSLLQGVLDEVQKASGSCGVLGADSSDETYKRLEGDRHTKKAGLAVKYAEYNQSTLQGTGQAYETGDADAAKGNAVSWIKRFNQMLTSFRTELYTNEFALTKFNYRTYGLTKEAADGNQKSAERSDPGSHVLVNQEAEYILYGLDSCMANISAAYGEMFVMLLAVRTTEALADPKKQVLQAGSPLLVFLAALAQGAVEAYADMNKLVAGDSVPIVRKLSAVTMDYKELLRIFYMLHSNDAAAMSRMQGLIELNTGKDLVVHASVVQASAKSSLQLWFGPLLANVVYASGGVGCKPQGNRCEMIKTAVLSY